MENRFTIKDLFLFLLIAALIVVMLVGMKQYDRQWTVMREIQRQGMDQTRELAAIRRALASGVPVQAGGGGTVPTTQASGNGAVTGGAYLAPFVRVNEAQQNADYALGDWLVDNFPAAVAKLTPLVAGDLYSRTVQNRVQETLTYRDAETLEYVPLLARSWQFSPDGLTLTFQLRQGVTFSDGHPMTADDVVFSFDFLMNPVIAAPRERSVFEPVESVKKTSDYEVVFKFKRPYYEALELAGNTLYVMPKHFYGKFKPEEFNQSVGLLMGTGPYKLRDPESWRPGTKIELLRNENYWGEPGPFARIIYNEIQERTAELTMFRNGELDRFAAEPDVYKELLKDQKLLGRTQHFEYLSPIGGYLYTAWNQQRNGKPTWFADKRVRQAMTMLIDRQRIVNDVFQGYAEIATGPFEPGSPQNDTSIKPWPYDPAAAKSLLAQAGFQDRNGDGVIDAPDGAAFRFKLTYPNSSELYQRVVLMMKDSLARAGIVLEPDPVDWPILQKKLENRDFDAISLRWGGGSVEGDIYQMFHSSQIADNGDDFMSYKNPELDATIEEARRTVNEQKRMPLWQKCHRILHEDQPYTFLTFNKSLVFIDKRFKNVETSKLGLNYMQVYVMPIPWYVPKGEQKYKE
jgi:peptide/nickel transport system substrate-binding protein